MANNHIFDFGEQGIFDTINLCECNGIATIGIVNRNDGKPHWFIKEVKGKKIGFINYCEHEFSVRDAGLIGANGYDAVKAFYEIQELRPQVDYLIVVYHGGNEYYPLPNPQMKKDFHFLADLGADAVIGHHTHVVSGYEIYKDKPLVYSLGNFFFPYPGEPEEWHTAVVCKMTIGSVIKIQLYPVIQCKGSEKVELFQGNSFVAEIELIENYSVTIANDTALEISWKNYVMKKQRGYLKQIFRVGFIAKVLLKLGFSENIIFNKSNMIGLYNLINCRAHYEVVKSSLKVKL
jgi:poly-gamma-glutamate synthesis protein (capsule biosynthesis protein)